MGCSQTQSKKQILLNLNKLKTPQNEAMTQSNFEKGNNKYNIMKNPIIMRRTEKRNKISSPCTPT